eukprot:CCRYP_009582-RA/>CCRYP_009582-RA protein AED:0.45 eAED:0.45 QI:121/1/0.5/1/0/0/2/0/59
MGLQFDQSGCRRRCGHLVDVPAVMLRIAWQSDVDTRTLLLFSLLLRLRQILIRNGVRHE